MKLVHWPLMGGWAVTTMGLGEAAARPVPSSLYQNVTAQPRMASVPSCGCNSLAVYK